MGTGALADIHSPCDGCPVPATHDFVDRTFYVDSLNDRTTK
jgi:hypothetical protein